MNKLKKIWAGVTGAAIGSGILLGVLLFVVMKPEPSASSQQTGSGTSADGVQTASVAGTQTTETTAQTPEVTPQTEALPQTAQQTQTETSAITVSPQVETQGQTQAAQTGDSTFYKDGTIVPAGSYIMREASERYLTDADFSRLTLKGLCYLKGVSWKKGRRP